MHEEQIDKLLLLRYERTRYDVRISDWTARTASHRGEGTLRFSSKDGLKGYKICGLLGCLLFPLRLG